MRCLWLDAAAAGHMPATPVGMDVKHSHLAASADKELDAHMFGMQVMRQAAAIDNTKHLFV